MAAKTSLRKTCLEDYAAAEREGVAEAWDILAQQAKTEDERTRRVLIAYGWRHSISGMLGDFRNR